MNIIEITTEGYIRIKNKTLNCIVQSVNVEDGLMMNNPSSDGENGRVNIITGYDDKKIDVNVKVIGNDLSGIHDVITEIRSVFESGDYFFSIVSDIINTYGINKVVFKGVSGSSKSGLLSQDITLTFSEYNASRTLTSATYKAIQAEKQNTAQESSGNTNDAQSQAKENLIGDKFSLKFMQGMRLVGMGQ